MNTHDDLLNYNEDMCFLPQDDIEDVCLQRNDDTCRICCFAISSKHMINLMINI